jgi:hypothetical protein
MAVQTQIQVRRGTASSWTSTNPTLAAGELGFETDTGKFKIGTGAATWTSLTYAGGGQNTLTTYQYTATSGQTTFSGVDSNGNTLSYTVGNIQVYLNGVLLVNTAEYTATSGTSIVLGTGAVTGDSLTVTSLGAFTVSSDIPKSTLTAKGSIVTATAGSTPANLSVGANGTVLTADSAETSGLKWATPESGGMTLINTGGTTLTGASVTISSIPATYKELYIYLENAVPATNDVQFNMRFNSDTSSIYNSIRSVDTTISKTGADKLGISFNISNTSSNGIGIVRIPNYFSTTAPKSYFSHSLFTYHPTTTQWLVSMITGIYNSTSAISSITLFPSSGNWTSGTAFVYGVS